MAGSAKSESRRIDREQRTVRAMIEIFCRGRHASVDGLCPECRKIDEYAVRRLSRCPFAANKPTCAQCPVHCYIPDLRRRIQAVMRYAGPRMLYRHPLLALRHRIDALQRSLCVLGSRGRK
ncbi:MAG: nitrous oxide-stimulated promoter family protein [Thermoguttaceae bacterium]